MVDRIDVYGLAEEYLKTVRELVRFLREKTESDQQLPKEQSDDGTPMAASWPLGAKENLTRRDIYE